MILGIAFLLMLYLCYKLAFQKTVEQYNQLTILRRDLERVSQKSSVPAERFKDINQRFENYKADSIGNDTKLLGFVSSYCDNNELTLVEYRPLGKRVVFKSTVSTKMIVVEGSFIECLRIVMQLEKASNIGRVSSLEFKVVKNSQIKVGMTLHCFILVENILDNA